MSENKQALQVAALKNGTVIDHIPSEKLFTVVQLLGVEQMTSNITIGFNLDSKKLGKKGIIKIADKFFCDEEINRISVVAPHVKLNIIRDYEVVEKKESIIYEIQQPQEEVVEVLVCDDTIPYGAYTSYSEANVTAQNALRQAAIEQGWFSSHYGVDTHQTECGTIYYTYWFEEFVMD